MKEHNSQCSLFHDEITSLSLQCTDGHVRSRNVVAVQSAQLILACLVTFQIVWCHRQYPDLVLLKIWIEWIKSWAQDALSGRLQGCCEIVLEWENQRAQQGRQTEGMLADNASRTQVCLPPQTETSQRADVQGCLGGFDVQRLREKLHVLSFGHQSRLKSLHVLGLSGNIGGGNSAHITQARRT